MCLALDGPPDLGIMELNRLTDISPDILSTLAPHAVSVNSTVHSPFCRITGWVQPNVAPIRASWGRHVLSTST